MLTPRPSKQSLRDLVVLWNWFYWIRLLGLHLAAISATATSAAATTATTTSAPAPTATTTTTSATPRTTVAAGLNGKISVLLTAVQDQRRATIYFEIRCDF